MTHAFRVGQVTTDHAGQRVHPQQAEQSTRLAHQLYSVGDHAWCFVGNGLSNQSFVRGPEGIIAIDTGESIEEMNDALRLCEPKRICRSSLVSTLIFITLRGPEPSSTSEAMSNFQSMVTRALPRT